MKSCKVQQTMTRIGLLAVLISTTLLGSGCATFGQKQILLHPVQREEFFSVPKGTQIGSLTTVNDGFFLSKEYVDQVVKILKIQDSK